MTGASAHYSLCVISLSAFSQQNFSVRRGWLQRDLMCAEESQIRLAPGSSRLLGLPGPLTALSSSSVSPALPSDTLQREHQHQSNAFLRLCCCRAAPEGCPYRFKLGWPHGIFSLQRS